MFRAFDKNTGKQSGNTICRRGLCDTYHLYGRRRPIYAIAAEGRDPHGWDYVAFALGGEARAGERTGSGGADGFIRVISALALLFRRYPLLKDFLYRHDIRRR